MNRIFAVVAAFGLAGCATDMTAADLAQCAAWGAPAGHSDHAYCMSARAELHAANRAQAAARFMAVSAAMARAGGASTAPARSQFQPAQPATTTCFARGEAAAGMNKICYYDCLGSLAAVTQSAVSLCPITIQR